MWRLIWMILPVMLVTGCGNIDIVARQQRMAAHAPQDAELLFDYWPNGIILHLTGDDALTARNCIQAALLSTRQFSRGIWLLPSAPYIPMPDGFFMEKSPADGLFTASHYGQFRIDFSCECIWVKDESTKDSWEMTYPPGVYDSVYKFVGLADAFREKYAAYTRRNISMSEVLKQFETSTPRVLWMKDERWKLCTPAETTRFWRVLRQTLREKQPHRLQRFPQPEFSYESQVKINVEANGYVPIPLWISSDGKSLLIRRQIAPITPTNADPSVYERYELDEPLW